MPFVSGCRVERGRFDEDPSSHTEPDGNRSPPGFNQQSAAERAAADDTSGIAGSQSERI